MESNNKNVVIFSFVTCKNMKNLKAFWTDLVLSMENHNLSLKSYSLFVFSFVETCMQLVHQGMSDDEAVENAIKTLEFGKKKVAVGMSDVCVLKSL